MSLEDRAYALIILLLFALASILIVWETRPFWAKERFLHQGILTSYETYGNVHVFHFSDNSTITEAGWLWKSYIRTGVTVSLYKKDGAIVVRQLSEPENTAEPPSTET